MPDRWRRELAGIDEISPDPERIEQRASIAPLSQTRVEVHRSRLVAGVTAIVVFILAVSLYAIPALQGRNDHSSPAPSTSQPTGPLFVPGAPKSAAIAEANKLIGL